MRNLKLFAAAAAFAALSATTAAAQSSPVAVGVNLGTTGVGLEAQFSVSDSLVVRSSADGLSFDHDETYSGVDYDGKLKSMTAGLFADWHPGGSAFLLSAGAYVGERKVKLDAQPSGNVEIGGATFTPAQVGRIEGQAKMSDVQPFAGVGFDNTFTGDGAWGFRALAGVAFSKSPDVTLRATGGTFSNDPAFLARLRQEEQDLQDDADGFKYYPVVQIGVTRRF